MFRLVTRTSLESAESRHSLEIAALPLSMVEMVELLTPLGLEAGAAARDHRESVPMPSYSQKGRQALVEVPPEAPGTIQPTKANPVGAQAQGAPVLESEVTHSPTAPAATAEMVGC